MDSLKHFRKRSSKSLPRDELANSALATFRPRSRKARLIARWPTLVTRRVSLLFVHRSCVSRTSSHPRRRRDEDDAVRDIIEVVPL